VGATVLLYLWFPVLVVVIFAFQKSSRLTLPYEGPSLRWFRFLATDSTFRAAFLASLRVAVAASVAAMVVGTLAGLALTRYRLRFARGVEFAALAPIALPGLFLGIALLTYFSRVGLHLSLVTVFLAHLLYVTPYVLLVVLSRLQRFDLVVEEAARDLGATAWQTFWRVTFPVIWPAIAAGALLAFALSFEEFLITLFVIGSDSTLPLVVWSRMRRTIDPSVNAVATLLLAVFALSLIAAALLLRVRRVPQTGATTDEVARSDQTPTIS
jgi:ABC-type spermidine/putrescine transport system permease subunit II